MLASPETMIATGIRISASHSAVPSAAIIPTTSARNEITQMMRTLKGAGRGQSGRSPSGAGGKLGGG